LLRGSRPGTGRRLARVCRSLAVAGIVLAAARPTVDVEPAGRATTLELAVDISGSSLASDVAPALLLVAGATAAAWTGWQPTAPPPAAAAAAADIPVQARPVSPGTRPLPTPVPPAGVTVAQDQQVQPVDDRDR